MSSPTAWFLARRLHHAHDNFNLESWEDIGAGEQPFRPPGGSAFGWNKGTGMQWWRTTVSGGPGGAWGAFTGHSALLSWQNATNASSFMIHYRLPIDSHTWLTDGDAHEIKASIRMLNLNASSGHSLGISIGGVPHIASNKAVGMTDVPDGNFSSRLVGSWQQLYSDLMTIQNSQQVQATVMRSVGYLGWLAVDDLRWRVDEIELFQHSRQRAEVETVPAGGRTLGGKLYGHRWAAKRRWTIPIEFVTSDYWPRLEQWYAEGVKLFLVDPSSRQYPVVFTNRTNPMRFTEGQSNLRQGLLELESDYRDDILGPVHGEPVP